MPAAIDGRVLPEPHPVQSDQETATIVVQVVEWRLEGMPDSELPIRLIIGLL